MIIGCVIGSDISKTGIEATLSVPSEIDTFSLGYLEVITGKGGRDRKDRFLVGVVRPGGKGDH